MSVTVPLKNTLLGATLILMSLTQIAAGEIPRPEHPRPDRFRADWINLNGIWEFCETDDGEESFLGRDLPDRITVPFCRESELSGLGRKGFVDYVWYRREFEIPEDWDGKRVLFHVEACDYETTVWVNGSKVGFHRGSSDAFSFDITSHLKPGANEVVLKVYDNVRTGLQPAGKQSLREESHGIFYTRTTGIWQTVWLEAVGQSYIDSFAIVPDPDRSRVRVTAKVDGDRTATRLVVEAFAGGESVGKTTANTRWNANEITVDLSKKKLWSPKSPFLYDLKISLLRGDETIDTVDSYFGLRKIEIEGRAILINDEPVFQRLVLDQGFYPDGVWTAPSDKALEDDVRLSMEAGFNGARLHQKVFEPRFLYHADRLGYLLWGEFPSFGMDYGDTVIDERVIREWQSLLVRDMNHPSIVGWCPFNETPKNSARLQNIVWDLTKALDPTRPLLDTSGWSHSYPNPDVSDAHDYNQDPASYKEKWEAFFASPSSLPARYGVRSGGELGLPYFVSEFGGIGWNITEGWGYGNTPESLDAFYARFKGLVDANLDNRNFFGYCYTQLTNVEQEQNGILNFDRTPKFDQKRLHEIQTRKAAYEKNPPVEITKTEKVDWRVLVPSAHDESAEGVWDYTTADPGEGWEKEGFDSSGWEKGRGGFGDEVGGEHRHTEWTTKDIWLRKTFDYDGADFDLANFVIFHDDDTKVHLNGEVVWLRPRWTSRYRAYEVTDDVNGILKKGKNTIAIHTHQDHGGQFIDLAFLVGTRK